MNNKEILKKFIVDYKKLLKKYPEVYIYANRANVIKASVGEDKIELPETPHYELQKYIEKENKELNECMGFMLDTSS
jgi:hypothetical protein